MRIDDQGHQSNITVFSGCVFNQRQLLHNARWTAYDLCELGGDIIVGNGLCSISNSYGFSGIKAFGARVSPECINIDNKPSS